MKIKALALISALLLVLGCFAGCEDEEKATPDEAPAVTATPDEVVTTAETTAASSAAETQPTTAQNQKSSVPANTQPTTVKPVQDNIPEDNITSENINPNLLLIQDLVIAEMNESMLRSVTLSQDKLTIKKGETASVKIYYEPEDAVPKTCTVKVDGKSAQASIKNGTLTVVGKSAGSAMVTVTAYSGAYAQCAVTVTDSSGSKEPAEITDDTVISHSKVCTRENAQRWYEAVDSYCADLGLNKNESLSGNSVVVKTSDYSSDGSYNSYKNQILGDITLQIDAYTGKNYGDYDYNCALDTVGSEFRISVTLYRISAE